MASYRTLTIVAAFGVAGLAPPVPAAPAPGGDAVAAGSTLLPGQSLVQDVTSTKGWGPTHAHLAMQQDGNLVLYVNLRGAHITGTWEQMPDVPVWHSGTAGHPGAYLALQDDGNAVVYDATGRVPLWQSATWGAPAARLVLRTDGEAVVEDASGAARWGTGTRYDGMALVAEDPVLWPGEQLEGYGASRFGNFWELDRRLVMQHDGNLVAYTGGAVRWQSGTAGNPGAYVVLQRDLNLVVYARDGRTPLWQSTTVASGAHDPYAVLRPEGLTLYDPVTQWRHLVYAG